MSIEMKHVNFVWATASSCLLLLLLPGYKSPSGEEEGYTWAEKKERKGAFVVLGAFCEESRNDGLLLLLLKD